MKRYRLTPVVVSCALVLAAGCSGRKSEQYRREGDTLFYLGKFNEAEGAYRRAEEVNPRNALAKVGQGRCLLVQQRFDEALAQFRAAAEIDPNAELAYQEAVRLLLRNGALEDARALAEKYESVNPERGGILHAYVLRESGKRAEAIEMLQGLRDRFGDSVDVRLNLSAAYLAVNQVDQAESEVKAILTDLDSESTAARMALIDVYQAQGKIAETVAEFEKLVEERPDDRGLKLGLARSLLAAGRAEEAEAIARPVCEEQPDSGWANHVLGSCLLARQQYAEALTYLQKAAAAMPAQKEVARKLAIARSGGTTGDDKAEPAPPAKAVPGPEVPQEGAAPDWRDLWKQAQVRSLVSGRAEYLSQGGPNVAETLALAALIAGKRDLANELAADLPEDSPLHGYFRAIESRRLQQLIEYMDQWNETDAERSVLRDNAFGFGLGLLGGRGYAIHVLSTCRAAAPDYGITLYNLAQVFRAARMPQFAAKCLQMLVSQAVRNMEAHSLLYAVLREGRLPKEAQRAAETTYSMFPSAEEAVLNLAQSYLDNEQFDLATKVLNRGIQKRPNNAAFQVALARVMVHSGKPQEALELLPGIEAASALARQASITKAFAAAGLNQWQQVGELGTDIDEKTVALPMRLLVAAAWIHTGRAEDARALIEKAEGSRARAGKPLAIIRAALAGKATADAAPEPPKNSDAALVRALRGSPAALGEFAYGTACLNARIYTAALAALQHVHEELGGSPALVGMILASMVHAVPQEERKSQATALVEQHPAMAAAWLGLARVLETLDDADGASADGASAAAEREALAKAAETGPDQAEVWRQYARFFERQDQLAEAVAPYRRLVKMAPEDATANNNLAYCLMMTGGDLEEALRCAEAAHAKRPSDPQILHTLGVVQLRRGDLDQSNRNLRLALELRPGDPTLLLDFGQLLIAQEQVEEGRRHIELALRYAGQLGLDFPRRAEAEGILSKS